MVRSRQDVIFEMVIITLLAIVGAAAVFPLLFVLSMSLTPYEVVIKNGGFVLLPKEITLFAYDYLFSKPAMPKAFMVNVMITVLGTLVNMILTVLLAYPLSRRNLRGRSLFLFLIVFTMMFNGGLIPTYFAVQSTGLLDTIWAMILPSAVWTFNLLIIKTFMEGLPQELFESARIDGAGEWRVLLQIAVPLSIPAMLTVGLFYVVGHWNEFFQAIMYVQDRDLQPLQVIVREILQATQNENINAEETLPTPTLQMAAVVMASAPVIVVYPLIQKHFTKGMLIGAIKG
ncbi:MULTISPECIES: carbohydrate ABC transporter permease [unclassified Paenibacillus]|uniref:carbohydrate ABC transporter permease n=1 Tax=unclassified Paenibacillus TaxID=185978 RepID=UPI0027835CC8|nr:MULTISPECIES: carbohydrate ABC transporter permease [unclassified Paenibacillus]MDQ0899088.1 putative aldouronate transport system permease protein [Paenibacillus sp. V4I7]MDQ0914929.1 putative aldouronate transport system permease protein [Paenibacillus sp. V4I5]